MSGILKAIYNVNKSDSIKMIETQAHEEVHELSVNESSIMKGIQAENELNSVNRELSYLGQFNQPDAEKLAAKHAKMMTDKVGEQFVVLPPDPKSPDQKTYSVVTADDAKWIKGRRGQVDEEGSRWSGGNGIPSPTTYEQENNKYKSRGVERIRTSEGI